jgi:hypothetical protein
MENWISCSVELLTRSLIRRIWSYVSGGCGAETVTKAQNVQLTEAQPAPSFRKVIFQRTLGSIGSLTGRMEPGPPAKTRDAHRLSRGGSMSLTESGPSLRMDEYERLSQATEHRG